MSAEQTEHEDDAADDCGDRAKQHESRDRGLARFLDEIGAADRCDAH
jgi:hypothetical protein